MRPPDKYEQRARELAIAAGLDPDARVGEGRGMPAWCTFRDAARQEHVVQGSAARSQLPPQAPQYQNSPLKVFGEHEDGTLAQMRNCMARRQRRRRRRSAPTAISATRSRSAA